MADSGQMIRAALESRARRGKIAGQNPDAFYVFQPADGLPPPGHQDNGRVHSFRGPFTADGLPVIGSMTT